MAPGFVPNPAYWSKRKASDGTVKYSCTPCADNRERSAHHCQKHEETNPHKAALRAFLRRKATANTTEASSGHPTASDMDQIIKEDGLRALLASATGSLHHRPYPASYPGLENPDYDFPGPSPVTGIDWHVAESTENTTLQSSPLHQTLSNLAKATLDLIDGNISEEELIERLSIGSDVELDPQYTGAQNTSTTTHGPTKRPRNRQTDSESSREWYPWPDKVTCTLDILMHLPRSVFSQRQLDLFLWLLTVNDVDAVPSIKQMKDLNVQLQHLCGVDTIPFSGKLGHVYHVNSLSQILAQEFANPKVRPHLHFYPEDSGCAVSEARQAARWLHEMPSEDTTPMIRLRDDDYYIFEPTMLVNNTFCIPHRWFIRNGSFYAKAWTLEIVSSDNHHAWRVHKDREIQISQNDLLKNFPKLCRDHQMYNIPHPSQLIDVRTKEEPHVLTRWDHTDPTVGNRWRAAAKGKRVMSVPLWTYCDDTSGNQSKKWNEHNSFLFTLAGLPGEQSAKEYNVHFLCTSNLAPPLEMLDGVVSQLETAQKEGVWAWDCVLNEPVLLIPCILALLGDNPMQSEFACHIGMRGKHFCRICMVKGLDTLAEDPEQQGHGLRASPTTLDATPIDTSGDETSTDAGSDGTDIQSTEVQSATEESGPLLEKKRKKGKFVESMAAMITRVAAFMKRGKPRVKSETQSKLESFFSLAKVVGTRTAMKEARTETGIKDPIQEHFLDGLHNAYKSERGIPKKQAALDAAVERLPPCITSPVWRLTGLDPHQDTPIEILHVVLLGFVKYFWRDVIANQIGNKEDKKELLSRRLVSFDTKGLNISPLNGRTLVYYAGSLTGRDFRAIAQAAPFVLYDLVTPECYDAWVALSRLVPLIWQPVIEDINEHTKVLEMEIDAFLLRTARWTTQWFNKPKFHLLLHLPDHIRRFGPAILFATEAFESFNAVIRAKSVHSNRQAPSRDIAQAFAQGNRVRHLFSGGYFLPRHLPAQDPNALLHADMTNQKGSQDPSKWTLEMWVTVGRGPLQLMSFSNTATSYLGLAFLDQLQDISGLCVLDKALPRAFSETITGQKLPNTSSRHRLFRTCLSFILSNGDTCQLGEYVMIRSPTAVIPFLARVDEIIQEVGSRAADSSLPDGVLVQLVDVTGTSARLRMPQLSLINHWLLVNYNDIVCTLNTQHECERHNCQTSGLRYVYQERVQTRQQVHILRCGMHDTSNNIASLLSRWFSMT
ncbi:hypothetical protein NLJ89_g5213 [Agrocybe chaxingu]|uniref:Uncharacterized protein n=1 Tax=Agrocybe chaxingu TaxID=84603 RepID=A0A9W8JYZ5_9AGAR|nr:hypothetical protein NLJ89_g5213 [Agrocybe chaxingu]